MARRVGADEIECHRFAQRDIGHDAADHGALLAQETPEQQQHLPQAVHGRAGAPRSSAEGGEHVLIQTLQHSAQEGLLVPEVVMEQAGTHARVLCHLAHRQTRATGHRVEGASAGEHGQIGL